MTNGVQALLDGVTRPGLPESERTARERFAASAIRDSATVAALLDPYTDGRFGPVTDAGLAALNRDNHASDRLDRWMQSRAVANQLVANTPGLTGWTTVPPGSGGMPVSPLLDQLATPVGPSPGSQGAFVPGRWTSLVGRVDTVEKTSPGNAPAQLDGQNVKWHSASTVADLSRQLADWTDSGQAAVSAAFISATNKALESALITDITAGATAQAAGTTMSASLDKGEGAAASAWPDGSAIVLICSPVDLAVVRRSYAAQQNPPSVVASPAQPSGTVLIFARAAVTIMASSMEILSTPRPSLLGLDLGTLRYALASPRDPASVIHATLPVVP